MVHVLSRFVIELHQHHFIDASDDKKPIKILSNMKKAFRKSLKRQTSLGTYFKNHLADDHPAPDHKSCAPILWQALAKKYRFNHPKDWYRIEAHWLDQIESFQEQPIDCPGRDGKMNNAITRISQCNESYQVCNSLPRSFIVPKDLKDVTLMDTMSTVIKDHRVPIISYCCPIEYRRNFIIRCASSDQQQRVVDTLSRAVKPLKVFNLTSIAPGFDSIESAHKKLRDACRPKDDDQTLNFLSKTGKWLNIASQALKIVDDTARTLLSEASVILIEDDDSGWNSLVSSLIQLILEPHRRTIEGYESLISKEWIYLAGGRKDFTQPDILFTLFLDCTYQIYLQNTNEFEFTSEYLRYLFDAQYVSAPPQENAEHAARISPQVVEIECPDNSSSCDNNNSIYHVQRTIGIMARSKTTSCAQDDVPDVDLGVYNIYKPSSISLVELELSLKNTLNGACTSLSDDVLIESGYRVSMMSPFYKPNKDRPMLKVYSHVANMRLWSSLYLRWSQPQMKYGCIEETLYLGTGQLERETAESTNSPNQGSAVISG